MIFIFLITSADSASYIVAQMTDQGSIDPPLVKRLAWGGLIAAICLTLIATGGLEGLQSAAVLAALPFTLILFAMVYTLFRELRPLRSSKGPHAGLALEARQPLGHGAAPGRATARALDPRR